MYQCRMPAFLNGPGACERCLDPSMKEGTFEQCIELVQLLVSLSALECGRMYVVRMSLGVAAPSVIATWWDVN